MPPYPKFEAKIRDRILDPSAQQAAKPGYAVVLSFDKQFNTCTIATAQPGSDMLGEVTADVPCPMQSGVQGVSPKPGLLCWIDYRDGATTTPFITHFFNPMFQTNNYHEQYKATMDTPRYMLGL